MTWTELCQRLRKSSGYVLVTHRLDGGHVSVSYSMEPGGMRVSARMVEDAIRRGALVPRDQGLIADGKPQSYELDAFFR